MRHKIGPLCFYASLFFSSALTGFGQGNDNSEGKRLFEAETFGGNGRTCRTCHSKETGTISPADAEKVFKKNPKDPLFASDGSDDGTGNGAARMLSGATILVQVPLAPNVKLVDNPSATHVTVRRGVPSTINTPALDPVLMWDGRQPDLESQALGAVKDHAQPAYLPSTADLDRIKAFQLTKEFFSSQELVNFAAGGPAPELPPGNTESEKRGRRFFEDVIDLRDGKHGLCASCHSGPMLNQTNRLLRLLFGVPPGTRFQSVLVSEMNTAGNPIQRFVFNEGKWNESRVESPDIGRSAVTGVRPEDDWTRSNFHAFKISQLRGVRDTGPYFHDNSAKTLEDVMIHYAKFFALPASGGITLTTQDQADVVAFMKLLR